MDSFNPVITGVGVVAPCGIGKTTFWDTLNAGLDSIHTITNFDTKQFSVAVGGEVQNFDPKKYLGAKGLRNLDRSARLLLVAAQEALDEIQFDVNEETTDAIGVCTGTTFSHLWSILAFDKEVFTEGLDFSNPALFPSTVINAASSQVSIRFNIQGFNATVSTGYTSSLEALKYSLNALSTDKAKIVLSGAVDALTYPLFFGFYKLGYMAGIKGLAVSCPFDTRRNGPLLAEGAAMLAIENEKDARKRNVPVYAKIKSVASYFDGFRIGKIHPQGLGLENAIRKALDEAGVNVADIDYISSCANSSQDLDKIEVRVLRKIFGRYLKDIPVSSIKSMIGETFSVSGALQIASCIGAMQKGIIPPTINLKERDPECNIDCVPNKAQAKEIKRALVTSFGHGGYNAACIIERYV